MHSSRLPKLSTLGLCALVSACASDGSESTATIRAAVDIGPSAHDVVAVRFDIVPASGDCTGTPISSQSVALEQELAPASTDGGASAAHLFASGLFTLPPGEYRSCATPLATGNVASTQCGQATALFSLAPEQTSDLVLVSQCQATANGGVDVAVTLNDPPKIDGVTVTTSAYTTVCESTVIQAVASDPNGDALSYAWSQVSGPATASLSPNQGSVRFWGSAPGDYVVRVVVTDTHAAQASFSLTLHVANATCVVPADVQAIFSTQCSPCHTSGTSGGLKLEPADVAYASLVGKGSANATCADRVRVIPGDAADSYLIAKLRNIAPICGVQMPRGRPALPDDQIATIEAWINALPH